MAIYVISDLHLSFGVNKPMTVFGDHWKGYEEKVKRDWLSRVKEEDTVLLAGDFSWATYLEQAKEDFAFLDTLPGKKVLLKGNHDYWWETVTKMKQFLEQNHFQHMEFLHNNAIETDDAILCGTRYWAEEAEQPNEKIFAREIGRAKCSLMKGQAINQARVEEGKLPKPILMVTHYPPDERILKEVEQYPISAWIYAHIHSNYEESKVTIPGIPSYLTSCDYLQFRLLEICPNQKPVLAETREKES